MPRRKFKKQSTRKSPQTKRQRAVVTKTPVTVSRLRQMIRSVRWSESYTSLLMGVVAVIVGVLFVVSFLRETHHIQQTSSTSTVASVTTAATATPAPSELAPSKKTYTVQAGDDLWHIAEKYYKSGYNWTDIAKANNLADPSMIFSGNVLVMPQVTPREVTHSAGSASSGQAPSAGSSTQENAITGNTYTVQKGDDLWHIAVRAYADGYQWTKIAQANNLSNPDLIFSGNVLNIPR